MVVKVVLRPPLLVLARFFRIRLALLPGGRGLVLKPGALVIGRLVSTILVSTILESTILNLTSKYYTRKYYNKFK